MVPNWIVLGQGFGCQFESLDLKWIYWAPGRTCQEGALHWGKETLGVVPWEEGEPKHYHRRDGEILSDLKRAGIVQLLLSKI